MKPLKKSAKNILIEQLDETPIVMQLECGIRLVYKQVLGTATTQIGFVVNAGAVNDVKGKEGTAHFFEHLVFRGSQNYSHRQIINQIELIGGELNAFTTKEITVVYAHALSTYLGKVYKLLKDIVLKNKISQTGIDKEKLIIREEMAMYEDSPEELIYDEFTELLFEKSKYGSSILGTRESLNNINQNDLEDFYQTYYRNDNMVLSVVSNLSLKEVLKKLDEKELTSKAEHSSTVTDEINSSTNSDQERQIFTVHKAKSLAQNYICLGAQAYPHRNPKRIALLLLNNILGGPGMNSKLNLELREKNAWTYHIESNYSAFKNKGLFTISLATDADKSLRSIRRIKKILLSMCTSDISERTLKQAKKQFVNQLLMAEESKHSQMIFNGKQLLWYGNTETVKHFLDMVETITPETIKQVANEVLHPSKISLLIYK